MSVEDMFWRWCGKRDGFFKRDRAPKLFSCEFLDYLMSEDVKEFISFIDSKRKNIMKEGVDLCVGYVHILWGGQKETEYVCYFPADDVIGVTVHYYSDYGLPGKVKEGLPKAFKHRETIDTSRVTLTEEMGVEWNRFYNEWMGVGEVRTIFSFRRAKRNPDVVVKTLDRAKDKAMHLANKALEYIESE